MERPVAYPDANEESDPKVSVRLSQGDLFLAACCSKADHSS